MKPASSLLILPELVTSLNRAIARGLSPLVKRELLSMSEWADKYFYLVAESSNLEGRWETLPYQRAIMNAIGGDEIRVVSWQKPARVGYTKIIVIAIGYNAEHKRRSQVVYQPTDTDARDFVKDEIDPAIRDVPVLRQVLLSDPEKKSQYNTRTKKNFIGSSLDIKGGKSARNFRRMTKDNVYYDELDGFDEDVEGEGEPTSLGDMRVSGSAFPKSVRGSTPGELGKSLIYSSMDDADLVFRRYLPCSDCGEFDYLKWSNIKYIDNDPSTTQLLCEQCGSLVGYSKYRDMDAKGEWRTEHGHYIDGDDNFFNVDGERIDPPYHIGFILWAAYSYFTTWPDLVAEWLAAIKADKKGNPNKLKTFVNTRLGEAWEVKGSSVNADIFLNRLENYGPEVPEKVLCITAGVDIQEDRIEVEVLGWGKDYENWSIDYNIIPGDTSVSPELKDSVWQKLNDFLLTVYTHESGVRLRIAATCIDSGFNTTTVYKFCKPRTKRGVYPIKGVAGQGRPIVGRATKANKEKVNVYPIGVDTAKEILYAHLKVIKPGPSYCHFPANYDAEYFEQLTSEKCVKKKVNGRSVRVWVLKVAGRRNEPLDCRNYARAAYDIFNPNMDRLAERFKARIAYEQSNPDNPQPKAGTRRRMLHKGVQS